LLEDLRLTFYAKEILANYVTLGGGGTKIFLHCMVFGAGNHSNVVTRGKGGLKIPFFALRNFRMFPYLQEIFLANKF